LCGEIKGFLSMHASNGKQKLCEWIPTLQLRANVWKLWSKWEIIQEKRGMMFKMQDDKLTAEELTIILELGDCAVKWWLSKRPLNWSDNGHLNNPTINCTWEKEKNLAKIVAILFDSGWNVDEDCLQ
jgi:hypothetical protein